MENSPEKQEFVLRRVPLKEFMVMLSDVYQSGADFVDLYGYVDKSKHQDEVIISVPEEYMNPEFKEEEKKEQPTKPPEIPPAHNKLLTYEDIEERISYG